MHDGNVHDGNVRQSPPMSHTGGGDIPSGISTTNSDGWTFTVARIPVEQTFPLRQAVLRPHEAVEELALPGDGDPTTAAFAAIDARGTVLSVARIARAVPPFPVDGLVPVGAPTWRLQGMATRPDARNQGIGAGVLAAAIDHVASRSEALVWCNARIPAIGFYRRAGFTTCGEEWVDPVIGPHIVMWRRVEAT